MDSRALKLLRLASRPNTPEGEALNALRAFQTEVSRGGGIEAVLSLSQGSAHPAQAHIPMSKKLALIADLEKRAEAAEASVDQLRRDLVRARGMIEQQAYQIVTMKASLSPFKLDDMPYPEFASRAKRLLGDIQAWAKEFCRQTGISERKITRARANGIAPKEIVKFLPTLKKM